MDTQRQIRISSLIQKELAVIFNKIAREYTSNKGLLISVAKVRVTTDLSISKTYLSIFPSSKASEVLEEIYKQKHLIRHQVSTNLRHQLRKMPQMTFYVDDSLDYIEDINKALKGEKNPIKNPELLQKRKKL